MQVIDYEKSSWFLLKNNDDYLLDVNCSHSSFGFSMLIQLSEQETRQYLQSGLEFIEQLAHDVQNHALTEYKHRAIFGDIGELVDETTMQWLQNSQDTGRKEVTGTLKADIQQGLASLEKGQGKPLDIEQTKARGRQLLNPRNGEQHRD